MSHVATAVMRLVGWLPLTWVRRAGAVLGKILYRFAASRRRVVLANLAACFPEMNMAERVELARNVFLRFAQAWMDRGWLWHRDKSILRKRLKLTGRLDELSGSQPVVIFAPHFVGLDAGGTAICVHLDRTLATIYTRQANPSIDRWAFKGRMRNGKMQLFQREDGPKPLLAALRSGALLYLLPDMDFGARESIFVPFFGVPAATVTSLSRFTRLGRAKLVPVVTSMTADGYEVHVHEAWAGYPTDDVVADTARMNRSLEAFVREHPDQYYWVHRRFKSRPAGEPALYG